LGENMTNLEEYNLAQIYKLTVTEIIKNGKIKNYRGNSTEFYTIVKNVNGVYVDLSDESRQLDGLTLNDNFEIYSIVRMIPLSNIMESTCESEKVRIKGLLK